jgi:hypothetical protein
MTNFEYDDALRLEAIREATKLVISGRTDNSVTTEAKYIYDFLNDSKGEVAETEVPPFDVMRYNGRLIQIVVSDKGGNDPA